MDPSHCWEFNSGRSRERSRSVTRLPDHVIWPVGVRHELSPNKATFKSGRKRRTGIETFTCFGMWKWCWKYGGGMMHRLEAFDLLSLLLVLFAWLSGERAVSGVRRGWLIGCFLVAISTFVSIYLYLFFTVGRSRARHFLSTFLVFYLFEGRLSRDLPFLNPPKLNTPSCWTLSCGTFYTFQISLSRQPSCFQSSILRYLVLNTSKSRRSQHRENESAWARRQQSRPLHKAVV
jgi:hypothetical protein